MLFHCLTDQLLKLRAAARKGAEEAEVGAEVGAEVTQAARILSHMIQSISHSPVGGREKSITS